MKTIVSREGWQKCPWTHLDRGRARAGDAFRMRDAKFHPGCTGDCMTVVGLPGGWICWVRKVGHMEILNEHLETYLKIPFGGGRISGDMFLIWRRM